MRTLSQHTPVVQWPQPAFSDVPPLAVARALASELRCLAGQHQLATEPLDICALARLGCFEVLEMDLGVSRGEHRGLLQALRSGFRICVDARPAGGGSMDGATLRHRTRLSSHTSSLTPSLRIGTQRRRAASSQSAPSRKGFLQQFARAVLVPPEVVAGKRPTPDSAARLADTWDVSLHVAIRALAEWHGARPFVALGYWKRRPDRVTVQWAGGAGSVLIQGPLRSASSVTRRRPSASTV